MKNKLGLILGLIFVVVALIFSYLVWGNYGYGYNELYINSELNQLYLGKLKSKNIVESNGAITFKLASVYKTEDVIKQLPGYDETYYKVEDDKTYNALLFNNDSIYYVHVTDTYNVSICDISTKQNVNGNDFYLLNFEKIETNYLTSLGSVSLLLSKALDSSMFNVCDSYLDVKAYSVLNNIKSVSDTYIYKINNNYTCEIL